MYLYNNSAQFSNKFIAILSMLLLQCGNGAAFAEGVAVPLPLAQAQGKMNLDLSSSKNNVSVIPAMMKGQPAASIQVGGNSVVVTAGSLLTPAQYVALTQVVSGKGQTLQIGANGAGVGGNLSVSALGSSFASLVIPANVTASNSILTLPLVVSGLLSTDGLLSATAGGSTFRILAGMVNIGATGAISTAAALRPINLSIYSLSNIINAGSISSSGTLSMTALANIANSGTITAAKGMDIKISSPSPVASLVNSGVISSTAGNLAISTISPVDMLVNNKSGLLQSVLGALNIVNGKGSAKPTTAILDGMLSANKGINIFGSDGAIELHADQINGALNITGGSAHVSVDSGTLQIGLQKLSGDPTYLNAAGDLILGTSTVKALVFPGENLALLARGNIIAFPGFSQIFLTSGSGKGGNLVAIAGFTPTGGSTGVEPNLTDGLVLTGGTTTIDFSAPFVDGGDIKLAGVDIKAGSTASTPSNGGNVSLYAVAGTKATGSVSVHSIDVSSTSKNGGNIELQGDIGGTISIGAPVPANGKLPTTTAVLNTIGKVQGGSINITGIKIPGVPTNISFDQTGTITAGAIPPGTNGVGNPAGQKVSINGAVSTNATAPPANCGGGSLTIKVDSDVDVYGTVTTGGRDTIVVSQVTVNSDNGNITFHDSINTSTIPASNSNMRGAGVFLNAFGLTSNKGDIQVGKDLKTAGPLGAGTVSANAPFGDIRIGFNLKSFSPVLVNGQGGIDASSKSGTGANVTLSAGSAGNPGSIQVGRGILTTGLNSGGNINLTANKTITIEGKNGINTTGVSANGGNIQITNGDAVLGTAGDHVFGILINGAVTSTGFNNAGAISVLDNGGMIYVNGPITSVAKNLSTGIGGTVTLGSTVFGTNPSYDVTVNGNIDTFGGSGGAVTINSGNTGGGAIPAQLGVISVGKIVADSKANFAAGNITLHAQTKLTTGLLNTQGLGGGGNVNLIAQDGAVNVLGSIVTSPIPKSSGNGANAGSVNINNILLPGMSDTGAGSFVFVKGNISTAGGITNDTAAGVNGGNAGIVQILTERADTSSFSPAIGGISITGSIDARGGNTKSLTGSGGSGSAVLLDAGTVRVDGTAAGSASINASAGQNGTKAFGNSPGAITINTYGTQPIPLYLNLTSTTPSEVALPGAMFEFGKSLFNGVAGALIVNSNIVPKGSAPVVGNRFVNGPISIQTGYPVQTIVEAGAPRLITAFGNFEGVNTRTTVTSSEALALYRVSRGLAQLIALDRLGAALDKSLAGSQPNFIAVNAFEFGPQLSAFNISTGSPDRTAIEFNATSTAINPTAYIQLPAKASSAPGIASSPAGHVILGTFSLVDLGGGQDKEQAIDIGAIPLIVGANSNSTQFTPVFGSGTGVISPSGTLNSSGSMSVVFLGSGSSRLFNAGTVDIDKQVWNVQNGKSLNFVSSESAAGTIPGSTISKIQANNFLQIHLGKNEIFAGDFTWLDQSNSTVSSLNLGIYAKSIKVGLHSLKSTPNFGSTIFGDVMAVTSVNLNSSGEINELGGRIAGTTISLNAMGIATMPGPGSAGGVLIQDALLQSSSTMKIESNQNIRFNNSVLLAGTDGKTIAAVSNTGRENASLVISALLNVHDQGASSSFKTVSGNMQVTGLLNGISLTQPGNVFESAGNLNFYGLGLNPFPLSGLGEQQTPTLIELSGTGTAALNLTIGSLPASLGSSFPVFGSSAFTGNVTVDGLFTAGTGVSIETQTTQNLIAAPGPSGIITIADASIITSKSGTIRINSTGLSGNPGIIEGGNVIIGADVLMSAGAANPFSTTPPNQLLLPSDISSSGAINITAFGGITVGNATVQQDNFKSYGGNIQLISFGNNSTDLTLGDLTTYNAQGGNVILLSNGNVLGGTSTATEAGNTIIARGVSSKVGGGVEISSGTVISQLNSIFSGPAIGLNIDPSNAANLNIAGITNPFDVLVGPASSVILTNSAAFGNTALIGNRSVILLTGAATNTVSLDSASINSLTALGQKETINKQDEFIVDTGEDEEESGIAFDNSGN